MSFKARSIQEVLLLPKRRCGVPVFLCVVFLQANLIVMLSLHLYRNHRGQDNWTIVEGQNRTMVVTQTTNATTNPITITTSPITTTTKLKEIAQSNYKGSHGGSNNDHNILRSKQNSSGAKSPHVTTPKPLYDASKCERAAQSFLRSYNSECEQSTRIYKKQNGHQAYLLPMCPCVPPNLRKCLVCYRCNNNYNNIQ